MELRQELLQVRTLILSQRMEQSLAVLQMSEAELMEQAAAECEKNPLLEMQYFEPGSRTYPTGSTYYDPDTDRDFINNIPKNSQSIGEYCISQLGERTISTVIYKICCVFANSLDEHGHLDFSIFSVLKQSKIPSSLIYDAYLEFLTLEPLGIGALNCAHCLWLQLSRDKQLRFARFFPHFNLLAADAYRKLTTMAGTSENEIKEFLSALSDLTPKPGAGLATPQATCYITPDIEIIPQEEGFCAQLVEERGWKLSINIHYPQSLQGQLDDQAVEYLQHKRTQAQYFIDAIRKREKTVQDIGNAIAHDQADFFQYGKIALRPYTLADIALYTGLHPSTISRGMKNKYLQCRWGVFPLRYFLAQGTGPLSQTQICVQLQKLVAQESPKTPLSDEQISVLLQQQGIAVARRTISKYRAMLHIPSASSRKLHKAQ